MRRKKNIKLKVENLIKKYNTKNPYRLCEKLKITIRLENMSEIKGFYNKILKNKYIIINENLDEYSQKIVLCHELGHAVLHNSKKVNFMKKNFFRYTDELEEEANEFAVYLLLEQYECYTEEIVNEMSLDLKVLEDIKKYIK